MTNRTDTRITRKGSGLNIRKDENGKMYDADAIRYVVWYQIGDSPGWYDDERAISLESAIDNVRRLRAEGFSACYLPLGQTP